MTPGRTAAAVAWLSVGVLAGCSSVELAPYQADPVLAALPTSCTTPATGTAEPPDAPALVPGGIAVVRSEGREVVLVANRSCVVTVDAASGATEPLPTHGDSIAPTMVDATSSGLAFTSSLSGSVRAINADGVVTFNVSGLNLPLGLRLMPGGYVLLAEFGNGRVLRAGPNADSRLRLVVDGLEGPVDLVIVDATRGYVSEVNAGRVSEFRLDRYERRSVASGLDRPEGIALLPDGRIAVAETGARRIVAVDPRNGRIQVLADNLPIGLESPGGPGDPYSISDLATGPDGTLYLSADRDRTLLRVTPRAMTRN
ncbi:MAG: hypothetical protein FJ197_06945 [Gammaproteobacteria bacterium]|nr:hypothetical protein [Gammaproteobacteria bacterium]